MEGNIKILKLLFCLFTTQLCANTNMSEIRLQVATYNVFVKFDSGPEFVDQLVIEKIEENQFAGKFISPNLFEVALEESNVEIKNDSQKYFFSFSVDEGGGSKSFALSIELPNNQNLEDTKGLISILIDNEFVKLGTIKLEKI